MKNVKEIKKDVQFCKALMDKLVSDVDKLENPDYGCVPGYTAIQNDIIRIRRELNEVRKSFAWDYGRGE